MVVEEELEALEWWTPMDTDRPHQIRTLCRKAMVHLHRFLNSEEN